MPLYNITGLDSANTIVDLFNVVDAIKEGWFGGFIIFSFYIITLAIFKDRNFYNVMLIDSFAATFIASLLLFNGLIGIVTLSICVVLLVASLIMKFWGDK